MERSTTDAYGYEIPIGAYASMSPVHKANKKALRESQYSIAEDNSVGIVITTPHESVVQENDRNKSRMSHYSVVDDVGKARQSVYSLADVNVLEAANPYECIGTMRPAPTVNQPKLARLEFTELWATRRICILGALAIIINLVLTICGLSMAVQGRNEIALMRSEVEKLKSQYGEQNIAADALKNDITAQVMQINSRVDIQQDLLIRRQDNLTVAFDSLSLEILRTFNLIGQRRGIRLVAGNSTSGRVEVFHNEIWGTVCDDYVDRTTGSLMCRLLGFKTATAIHRGSIYGPGSGQIWLDDLKCVGNETALEDCSHRSWGAHNCNHNEDLSLTCQ